jgi:sigma-B regulation protein RsbU (phosphoserine phosphatase)
MPFFSKLRSLYRMLGWPEKLFLVLLIVYAALRLLPSPSEFQLLALIATLIALVVTGLVVAVRLLRAGIRKVVWRLRNRLVVAYLFIAVVPVVLILVLLLIGAYLLTGQIAVYLVTTELERRAEALVGPTEGLITTPPQLRAERIRWMAPYFRERYPGMELLVRDRSEWRYPEASSIQLPPSEWGSTSGMVLKDGRVCLWAHIVSGATQALILAPLTGEVLDGLVPNLGMVTWLEEPGAAAGSGPAAPLAETSRPSPRERIPPAAHRFDTHVTGFYITQVAVWESPGEMRTRTLAVTSRFSAVLRTFFTQELDWFQLSLFLIVATLFLLVEIISLFIGVSMTRTITGAVHNLYEGTDRIMEGDFSHRIEVRGSDQLAELSGSFNRMTVNLERLLRVEKEKERLQSELEIAREVQNQLYPKTVPALQHLELTALCHPARVVSGDYHDYLSLQDSRVALAIGDVAGKGISAALLMATVQSSLRTQIRASLEAAAVATASGRPVAGDSVPTSRLVSQLNQQLYAFTSAEKFATFYFGVYDDQTSVLTYTNAGHPPPILIRNSEVLRLETNGMVVGAFPFAEYQESRIELAGGDLLVCFTDGVTEPENEYGEMFGEQGLIDVVMKNAWRKPADIIASVIATVQQWTNSPEQQDDMTLLLARRL